MDVRAVGRVLFLSALFSVSDGFIHHINSNYDRRSVTTTTKPTTRTTSATTASYSSSSSSSSSVRRQVLQNQPEVVSTSKGRADDKHNDNDNADRPATEWWKDVQLEYGDIAERTRPDFEILLKTTIGGDSESNHSDNAKPLIYLDSAATSQKPRQVIQAITDYYNQINSNVHRGAHTLSRKATDAFEEGRDVVAALVNANSRNEIVFTSGATEAINLVAYSYGRTNLQEGDEIILTEMEHHSNLVPWQIIAKETGAVIRYARIDFEKGGVDLDHFESLVTERTKIVSFQHVSNVMACINPVKDMVATVRSKAPDAVVVLDACQSVPHMKVDVQQLGVDFLAASGHKMCGPTGIGFLWGREDILNGMPPYMGGGEMIDQVTLEGSTYAASPARFEAGTPPIAQVIGLASAIRYLQSIGLDNVESYEHEIAAYLYKRLSGVKGVHVLGPPAGVERVALCAFVVDGVHPSDLSTFLDIEGIAIRAGHHCCQPLHRARDVSHSARASLYFYNTKE
jgi:cysteine desulfurase/selenocysteine lyase